MKNQIKEMGAKRHSCVKQQRVVAFLLLSLLLCGYPSYGQQKVIRLYEGKPAGSEKWNWQEQTSGSDPSKSNVVYNVTEPTLTMFPAQGSVNTGTAVIIAPGGGLFTLSMDSEGTQVAEWLSKKGITAFVLKYRLVHISSDPPKALGAAIASGKVDSLIRPLIPLAMKDGLSAVAHIRKNAEAYKINPGRIGFMGFSAGGGIAMSVAYNATDVNRPNFIAPIYAWNKNIIGSSVPTQTMPAFIVVASNDQAKLVSTSIDIFTKWKAANQQAQLFIYQNGGHGFGLRQQNKVSDSWIYRFEEWLDANGLLKPA